MRFFVGLAGALLVAGCYETQSLRITARSPISSQPCLELADQTFAEAGYVRVRSTVGKLVYTPRGPQVTHDTLPFRWGIELSLSGQIDDPMAVGACAFALQAVSGDPSCELQCSSPPRPSPPVDQYGRDYRGDMPCGLDCPLTPQPGPVYDTAVREMGHRLETFGLRRAEAP